MRPLVGMLFLNLTTVVENVVELFKKHIAIECKMMLAHACVLLIASRVFAKAYTHPGQSERLRPMCANQNATSQLCQSGPVSCPYAQAVKDEF